MRLGFSLSLGGGSRPSLYTLPPPALIIGGPNITASLEASGADWIVTVWAWAAPFLAAGILRRAAV